MSWKRTLAKEIAKAALEAFFTAAAAHLADRWFSPKEEPEKTKEDDDKD